LLQRRQTIQKIEYKFKNNSAKNKEDCYFLIEEVTAENKLTIKQLTTLLTSLFFTTSVFSEELTIGLGNFEPQFSTEGKSALFKDILDGVFAYIPEYKINYKYMLSNAKLVSELNAKNIDGAANIFAQEEISGCLSDPVFRYTDVAVSLKRKNHKIEKIEDLAGKSIVTYQRAEFLLGETFKRVVHQSDNYNEVARPEKQAKMLASNLVDISIGDKYIFLNSLTNWKKDKFEPSNFVFHSVFPDVYSSVGFNKQAHCDAFNKALDTFKKEGSYESIYQSYMNKLGYSSSEK